MASKFDVSRITDQRKLYHLQKQSDFFQSDLEKYRGNQQIYEVNVYHKSSPNFSKKIEKSN